MVTDDFFTDPVAGCRLRLGYGDGVRPNHPLAVAVLSLGGVGCNLVAILAPEGVPLYPIG